MHKNRTQILHQAEPKNSHHVLYWLQHTQRIDQNYALYQAIDYANTHDQSLKVLFVLNPDYPEANARHFTFMLEGIVELMDELVQLGAETDIIQGDFETVLPKHIEEASAFFMDKAYTRYLREIKTNMAQHAIHNDIPTFVVESDLIVPIEQASEKLEYAARTIRPKIHKIKDDYLNLFACPTLKNKNPNAQTLIQGELQDFIQQLPIDHNVKKAPGFKGGEKAALERLNDFIDQGLEHYENANDPSKPWNSYLSPYLHFGMISPVRIYQEIDVAYQTKKIPQGAYEGFIEQLLIRRELAFNFIYYEPGYDQFDTMTYPWAYQTMQDHQDDPREYVYTTDDYESLNTHDIYFNKAMQDMMEKGTMPNYMRMYWGKKILEWSKTYKEAYETTLYLNNKYFLDGRDASSYTGVAWIYGRHDRPWTERAIFGKLRYMNENGLKRKFDMESYLTL